MDRACLAAGVVAAYVGLSSVLGTLGGGGVHFLFLPWLWLTSAAADVVFVAGSVAAFLLAHRVALRLPAAGAAVGVVLTVLVYAAGLTFLIVESRGDFRTGYDLLWIGWVGILFGGLAPWWVARSGLLAAPPAPRREVVLAEA